MFLGKHVRLFLKSCSCFKKTRTCFSMEDKEGSKDKKNFYNNSLFPHHLRKIVNIHKAKKSFHFLVLAKGKCLSLPHFTIRIKWRNNH